MVGLAYIFALTTVSGLFEVTSVRDILILYSVSKKNGTLVNR